MWKLTIEQTTPTTYADKRIDPETQETIVETKTFDNRERIVLKSDNHDKLLLTASTMAEAYPEENITYKLEREVEENGN